MFSTPLPFWGLRAYATTSSDMELSDQTRKKFFISVIYKQKTGGVGLGDAFLLVYHVQSQRFDKHGLLVISNL